MGLGLECGAVTGAFLILGLGLGEVPLEKDARSRSYEMARDFARRFVGLHGAIQCKELLGVDLATAEGREEAAKRNLFKTVCPVYVKDAALILSEIMR